MSLARDLERAYQSRRMLYENREALSEALQQEVQQEEEQDPLHKEISDAIVKGQAMLHQSIVESAKASRLKQDIEGALKRAKTAQFDISQRLEQLKSICDGHSIEVESLQDAIDQIEYSVSMISDGIDRELSKKLVEASADIERHKKTMRGLGRAYNVLLDCSASCTCPVCMNHPVEMFCDPCGHSFCTKCTVMIKNYCYFCRAPVKKMHKLYFL